MDKKERIKIISTLIYDYAVMRRRITSIQQNWPMTFPEPQRNIFGMLIRHPKGLSIKQISKMSDVTSSATTQQIEAMEKAGIVVRNISDTDRRSVIVTLTAQAKKNIFEDGMPSFSASVDESVFSALTTKELKRFQTLTAKVANFVEPTEQ